MRGNTHLWIGAAVGAAVAAVSHEPVVPLIAAGVVGGLGPDLDHPKSILSRFLWPLYLIAPGVSRGQYRNGRRWLWFHLEWHRERIHSIAMGLPVALLLGLLWWPLGVAFLAGWLSHLAADLPQPSRVPYLLWPIVRCPLVLPKGLPAFSEAGRLDTFVLEPLVQLVSGAVVVLLAAPDVLHGFVSVVAAGR